MPGARKQGEEQQQSQQEQRKAELHFKKTKRTNSRLYNKVYNASLK